MYKREKSQNMDSENDKNDENDLVFDMFNEMK